MAPPDRPNSYEGLPFPHRVLTFLFRRFPWFVYLFRRMGHATVQGDPVAVAEKLAASLPPADRAIFEVPEIQRLFMADIQEGYRQGGQGPAVDDILAHRPWGFRMEEIPTRIDVWHGQVDVNVALRQGQYQHEMIPNSRLTVWPGQAHLAVLTRWRKVLAALVQDHPLYIPSG
jgi:hypothetical protein